MSMPEAQIARGTAAPGLRLAWLWWSVGWAMVVYITVSCLEPARYVPNLHLWDKAEHALAFFGMSVWFGGLVRRGRYPLIAVLMLLFGGAIEIAQGTMGLGRDADIMDWLADSVGIALALGVLYLGLGGWMLCIERLVYSARARS
jgi:VanZ family protein